MNSLGDLHFHHSLPKRTAHVLEKADLFLLVEVPVENFQEWREDSLCVRLRASLFLCLVYSRLAPDIIQYDKAGSQVPES